ncbi:MAG: hypothetical protein JNN07_25240 [Verrucomicrobiales bacterium]|nr:hypothetical protein [Verrucomicrobiales bacterium]
MIGNLRAYSVSTWVVVASLLGGWSSWAGRIVVSNDEFPLSNAGFIEPNDAQRFALNLATWFVDSRAGRFLVISSDQGLVGDRLAATMTGAGHLWTVTNQAPTDLEAMKPYDAIFVCNTAVPPLLLIDYVNGGGNVCVVGLGLPADGTLWNPFLRRFGLEFSTIRTEGPVDLSVSSAHPLFAGVDHLRQFIGSSIRDLDPGDTSSEVILSSSGLGLFAVADSRTYRDFEIPSVRVSEVEISWRGKPDTSYRIEYRSTLTDNLWVQLDPNYCVTGDGSILRYLDRVSIQEPRRYYRVVVADCSGEVLQGRIVN